MRQSGLDLLAAADLLTMATDRAHALELLAQSVPVYDDMSRDAALVAIAHPQRLDICWATLVGHLSSAVAGTGRMQPGEALLCLEQPREKDVSRARLIDAAKGVGSSHFLAVEFYRFESWGFLQASNLFNSKKEHISWNEAPSFRDSDWSGPHCALSIGSPEKRNDTSLSAAIAETHHCRSGMMGS